ncbi:DUF1871 family protein [Chryseomicrobium sp. FSL W7-1435]|uniref:DUF1871 family protein n=1 Tax=Chryseomicrobium sp. FSL W7-1435 TaxID=2921704 RepID=UPI00315A37FE
MHQIDMNKQAVRILGEWDPFQIGADLYAAEAADVVAFLQGAIHPSDVAHHIQMVYEHSFEEWIPLEKCVEISYKLIALKLSVTCSI